MEIEPRRRRFPRRLGNDRSPSKGMTITVKTIRVVKFFDDWVEASLETLNKTMLFPSLRYARARRTRFYIYAMCLVDEKNMIIFSLLFFSFLFFFLQFEKWRHRGTVKRRKIRRFGNLEWLPMMYERTFATFWIIFIGYALIYSWTVYRNLSSRAVFE